MAAQATPSGSGGEAYMLLSYLFMQHLSASMASLFMIGRPYSGHRIWKCDDATSLDESCCSATILDVKW